MPLEIGDQIPEFKFIFSCAIYMHEMFVLTTNLPDPELERAFFPILGGSRAQGWQMLGDLDARSIDQKVNSCWEKLGYRPRPVAEDDLISI